MESQKNGDLPLCDNDCSFFASAENSNLCSKCFKTAEAEDLATAESGILASTVEPSNLPPQASPGNLTFSTATLQVSSSPVNSNNHRSSSSFGKSSGPYRFSHVVFGPSANNNHFSLSFDRHDTPAGKFFYSRNNSSVSSMKFTFGASGNTKVVNRCSSCNKRVGLTGFQCRCGNMFCGKHRYPEEHACEYDFKAAGRLLLLQQNTVCKGDKLQRMI